MGVENAHTYLNDAKKHIIGVELTVSYYKERR
jgi:hypothetical protein